jgi:hypothetical protein
MAAISGVSEEESARLCDQAYSNFLTELDQTINIETMPVSEHFLESEFTKL